MSETDTADGTPTRRSSRAATMASIAAHIGLSRATVTLVLNGKAAEQKIRPETQRRVLEAARELGYRPNTSARAIRTGRFGNIGFVQAQGMEYLPTEMLRGVSDAIRSQRYNLMYNEVPPDVVDDPEFLLGVVRTLSVDGLLINHMSQLSQRFVDLVREYRIPAIFLNIDDPCDCIYPDERYAGHAVTEHLLAMGHTRIAYVGANTVDPHFSERDRRRGYDEAMQSAGLPVQHIMLPDTAKASYTEEGEDPVAMARRILDRQDRPTALIAYELAEAMAVTHAANQLNLSFPRDLSLIMFHRGWEHRTIQHITTFTNAMVRMGEGAVAMVLQKIEQPDVLLPSRAEIGQLIEADTCGPPPR